MLPSLRDVHRCNWPCVRLFSCPAHDDGSCVPFAAVAVDYALIAGVDYEPSTFITTSPGVPSPTACGILCNSYGRACASFLYDTGGTGTCTLYGSTTSAPSSVSTVAVRYSAVQTSDGFAVLTQTAIAAVTSTAQASTIQACPGLCVAPCEFAVFNGGICTLYRNAIFSASVSATATTFFRQNVQYTTP